MTRRARAGDLVILVTYGEMEDAEAHAHIPEVVFVDGKSRTIELADRKRSGTEMSRRVAPTA